MATIGEGLIALGQGIGKRKAEEKKVKEEQDKRESFASAIKGFLPENTRLESLLFDEEGKARDVEEITSGLEAISKLREFGIEQNLLQRVPGQRIADTDRITTALTPIERPKGLRETALEQQRVSAPLRLETLRVGGATFKPIETEEQIESDRQRKLEDLKATGEIASQKQLNSQILKNREKSKIDTLRAELKIGNTLDSFLDLVKRNQEITGVAPGPLSGLLINILTPTQLNQFRDGFQGGLIEVAAATARISMPGTRAVRAITLFKKTTVSEWETVESAIQTSADSYRNAITTNMGEDPKFYIEDYKNTLEDNRRLGLMARDFEKTFRKMALEEVFNKNPELLLPQTRMRLEQEQRLKAQFIKDNPDRFELIEEE